MTSVRARTCAAGAAVAALAGILVVHGAFFGADFTRTVVLGVVLGALLGLVPHRSPIERVGGFAVGFIAAWVGYLLRAGMLPDIPLGRGIAVVLVLSAITAVATATANRIPLWAGLLGAGTLVGAYEATYVASPSTVSADSLAAATAVLLAVAFGFVVTSVISAVTPTTAAPAPAHGGPARDDLDLSAAPADTAPAPRPRVDNDVPTTSETNR
jgi:hypothetical protein